MAKTPSSKKTTAARGHPAAKTNGAAVDKPDTDAPAALGTTPAPTVPASQEVAPKTGKPTTAPESATRAAKSTRAAPAAPAQPAAVKPGAVGGRPIQKPEPHPKPEPKPTPAVIKPAVVKPAIEQRPTPDEPGIDKTAEARPTQPGPDLSEPEAPRHDAEGIPVGELEALEAPAPELAPELAPDLAPAPPAEPQPSAPDISYRPALFIVQITPELAPVAKVGGLADVVFGLTRELAIRGNHVETILPKYDTLRYDHIFDLRPVFDDLWVPWYDKAIHCTVYFGFVHGRKCFFIEPHSPDNFFSRGSIYGFPDDVMRFVFFSRAAMELLLKTGKHPDVIHCHDWQTALAPVLLYEIYQHLGMTHPRVCLTIHNFKHQGVTGTEMLRASGLHNPERYLNDRQMGDDQTPGTLNLLKGGIVYSNFVTTVSPRYAFETKDQGQGFGLEPTLHTHQVKYGGVVNGVDYDVWNPEIDHHIPARFGLDNLDGKYENKRALRHRLMLADNEKPIVAFIGRLDPQKGLELVRHAIFYSLEHGGQFVLLGSSPDPGINADFWGLKNMLNDSPDCHLEIGFDEDLSHLVYAGADMILVPSRFEPCGLTQLIAMRYGTVPIVRAVGGLADTVFDKDHSHRPLHERNGYVFENYDQTGLESALGRAIACYFNHPDHFRDLMKNAMRYDYSWNRPGEDYLNIYDYIREK
jgi:starch synthase